MIGSGTFDESGCHYLVAAYLRGQGWELAEPRALASEVWLALRGQLCGEERVAQVRERVHRETWLRYAALLHDFCRDNAGPDYERAWTELSEWLQRRAMTSSYARVDVDELAQETLLAIQQRLLKGALQDARAFLVFSLAVLRNKNIDLQRRYVAEKRGGGVVLSLEAIGEAGEDGGAHLELADGDDLRPVETASDERRAARSVRRTLQRLPTALQRETAALLFLDGLQPAQIARLMNKTPHQIRMVKYRLAGVLRDHLPEET